MWATMMIQEWISGRIAERIQDVFSAEDHGGNCVEVDSVARERIQERNVQEVIFPSANFEWRVSISHSRTGVVNLVIQCMVVHHRTTRKETPSWCDDALRAHAEQTDSFSLVHGVHWRS